MPESNQDASIESLLAAAVAPVPPPAPAPPPPTAVIPDLPVLPEVTQAPARAPLSPDVVIDWDAAARHLASYKRDIVANNAGKDGCNPYVWLTDIVLPLERRLSRGERSDELFQDIFELNPTKPCLIDMTSSVAKPVR